MAKTKKEKSLKQILDEALVKENEWPYRIPDNWVWIKLEAINFRKPASLDPRKYPNNTFELYSVPSFVTDLPEVIKGNEIKSGKQLVQQGDILLCKINPRINRVWIVASHTDFNKIASSEWIVISLPKTISKDYLMWLLRVNYFRNLLTSNVSGVGGSLTRARPVDVASYPIPVPPLEEQKKIIKKLSSMLAKLKEARELVQEAKDSFENRRATILNKAFTGELTRKWPEENSDEVSHNIEFQKFEKEPYELPRTWKWVKLKDIGSLERGKSKHRPRNDPKLFGGEYPFIQTGDVARSDLEVIEHNQTLSEFGLAQSKLFPKGTVCITIAANIADTAILTYDCCFPDSVVGFTPNSEFCSSKYINYYMETIKSDLEEYAPATAQKNINLKILREVLVPIQLLDEQNKIVRIIDRILKNEKEIQALIDLENQIGLIEKSILSKAFRGELDTNDPNDEPAIKLLERILEEKKSKPIILKPDDIKTSGSVSKPELLVKGHSGNTQVLLEEIKNKYGNKTFRANELKNISELSYDEFKDALFELLENKLTMEFDENEEVIRYQLKK